MTTLALALLLASGPTTAPSGPCSDQDWDGGARAMRRAIGCVWDRFDPDERTKAIRVAECESGLRPDANENPPYLGLYQHARTYWAERFTRFITDHDLRSTWGLSPSIWSGRTQAIVTALFVRRGSWGAWSCA